MTVVLDRNRALGVALDWCARERARLVACPWSRETSRALENVDALREAVWAVLEDQALNVARKLIEPFVDGDPEGPP